MAKFRVDVTHIFVSLIVYKIGAVIGNAFYTVSQKKTLTLHTIISMHINRFW